ncbi:MAG: hypothetical protein ACO3AT_01960 [Ilumatobacteraceae bacterium]
MSILLVSGGRGNRSGRVTGRFTSTASLWHVPGKFAGYTALGVRPDGSVVTL